MPSHKGTTIIALLLTALMSCACVITGPGKHTIYLNNNGGVGVYTAISSISFDNYPDDEKVADMNALFAGDFRPLSAKGVMHSYCPSFSHISWSEAGWYNEWGRVELNYYYILDAESIQRNAQKENDRVWYVKKEWILACYELTEPILIKMDYKLHFPPSPEMADIRMWPSYEELIQKYGANEP